MTRQLIVSGTLVVLAATGVAVGVTEATSSSGAQRAATVPGNRVVVTSPSRPDEFVVSRIGLGDFTSPGSWGRRPGA